LALNVALAFIDVRGCFKCGRAQPLLATGKERKMETNAIPRIDYSAISHYSATALTLYLFGAMKNEPGRREWG
jgi:hypothetical protein